MSRLPRHTTRFMKMTGRAASTPINRLEAALAKNEIVVTEGAVQRLLDQKQWIYRSERVKDLLKRLTEDQLYSAFRAEHHISSATRLFKFLKKQDCAVVYGHKAQGKTQFLFFVFKLLQAVGEKVLYLDRTILPAASNTIDIDSDMFCGHQWKDSFQMEGEVGIALNKFYKDALQDSFVKFLEALHEYAERKSTTRIWIIIDDVVLFENRKIELPEKQEFGPFKWIVTGSAGIGTWVAKRRLDEQVFELPLFTNKQCLDFAKKLCNSLEIDPADELAVPKAGVSFWLEEKFGGVIGYIAEMFLEVAEGKYPSDYLSILSDRVDTVISAAAKKRGISEKALARDWLREISSKDNTWRSFCDAGLCGRGPPRGIIFSFILQRLYTLSSSGLGYSL